MSCHVQDLGARVLFLAAALLFSSTAAQNIPACAWSNSDTFCPGFEVGTFTVGKLGEDACPKDSTKIVDAASCKMAASAIGFQWRDENTQEGSECHWCGACDPQHVRLNAAHGPFAKWVCSKVEKSSPGATQAPAQPPQGTPGEWPGCQETNTVIRNAGQALFTNLQGFGATIGCFLDDCLSSDKFVAGEIESCAKVCHSLPECEYWVWGTEEGEQKCWFRTGDAGREAGDGWISGHKKCSPPGTEVLPMGNNECWAEGFGYDQCCDAKYGPNGNAQCWDGVYNYDRCCFPKDEL